MKPCFRSYQPLVSKIFFFKNFVLANILYAEMFSKNTIIFLKTFKLNPTILNSNTIGFFKRIFMKIPYKEGLWIAKKFCLEVWNNGIKWYKIDGLTNLFFIYGKQTIKCFAFIEFDQKFTIFRYGSWLNCFLIFK